MHHRSRAQPSNQLARIACLEDVVEGVVLALALEPFVLRDEVQVVVAEDDYRASTQIAHEAQHLERLRPAVDEVAHEPEPVRSLSIIALPQQRLELVEAALDITNRVRRHQPNRSAE